MFECHLSLASHACSFFDIMTVAMLLQANSTTLLPVTWLPLSQYARYFEEVMRFQGYQVRRVSPWLCTDSAELNTSSRGVCPW